MAEGIEKNIIIKSKRSLLLSIVSRQEYYNDLNIANIKITCDTSSSPNPLLEVEEA